MRKTSLIIPAYNEAETIGGIVEVALESELFKEVVVVDDGSTDDTAKIAQDAGAIVISHPINLGKSQAIKTGMDNTSGGFVCFIDADLIDLDMRHLWELTHPVVSIGIAGASVAVIGTLAQILFPFLSGQRCFKRNLLDDFDRWNVGFGFEIALSHHLRRKGVKQHKVYWWGVSQIMKEKKRGLIRGFLDRLNMYKQIVCTYMKELLHH